MKRVIAIILLILILSGAAFLLLNTIGGCTVLDDTLDFFLEEKSDSSKTVTSTNLIYRLEVPGHWNDFTDKESGTAILEAGNQRNREYVTLVSESKMDFIVSGIEIDLSSYAEQAFTQNKSMLADLSKQSTQELTVAGKHPAILTKVTGKLKDTEVTYWFYALEFENHFTQVIFWSESRKADRFEPVFESVLQSIRYTPEAEPAEEGSTN